MSKVALSQPTVPPRQEPPRARAVVGETTSQGGTDEVLRLLKELVLQGNNGPHPPPNRTMPVPRPERTRTGRVVCFRCNEVGHIARFCRNDQPVRAADLAAPRGTSRVSHVLPSAEVLWGQGRTAYHGDRQINTVAATASLPVGQVDPVLTIDPTNLVRDAVNCNGVLVSAVIDTGAAVTIVSPALVKSLNLRDEGWTGQLLTVATGQRVVPLGSVTVTVSNKNGVASGTALIMEMSGINLLLGNDFLRQFRSLTIEYGGDRPELTLGVEESLSNPVPAEVPIVAKSLQSLPAHTLTAVAIDRPTLANYGGPYLLEPSVNLLQAKSLTMGRTLLPDQPTPGFVMMLNLAHSDTTIMPDTTLDTVFPVSEPMTMQDTEAEPVNGIDLTDTFAEDLQPTDREELIKCFRKHSTCFASDDSDTGLCVRVEHDILTGDAAPTTTLPDAPAQGPCVSTSTLPFSPTGSSQSSDGSVDEDTSSSDTESLRQGPRQNLDRLRRPPQRSLLTLPILLLTVLSSGAIHLGNQLVTDGAIFRAHGNRVLSTSEWVIVTDVDLHYALTLLGDTETWLRAAAIMGSQTGGNQMTTASRGSSYY